MTKEDHQYETLAVALTAI